jgi:HK97 family phage major capsid protein
MDNIRALPAALQGAQSRAFSAKGANIDETARTVELSFSSEIEGDRAMYVEILDHSPKAVRLGRLNGGAPLLVDHDTRDVIGVVERAWVSEDRKGRALVRFSRNGRAQEVFQDVLDGIRSLVSVAYRVHDAMQERLDGQIPVFRVTDWEPYEISIVGVPLDETVGVGRSANPPPPHSERKVMEQNQNPAPAPTPAPVDVSVVENRARTAELARVNAILAAGEQYAKHGGQEIAARCIREGKSLEDFNRELLTRMSNNPSKPGTELDLSERETRSYSLLRAIRAMASNNWKEAGFERECHDALVARGLQPTANGFFVPWDVQARLTMPVNLRALQRQDPAAATALMKRDLTAGTDSAGGFLVATDNLAASFIELLRARAKVVQLGAITLPGLVGDVTIPKQSAAATAYWLANEGTGITESQQTFGQLALTPKNVGAYTEISRQLMMQSSPAADMLVMNDLSRVIGLAIDAAALSGSGASGQPTGLANTGGIGSVTGTTLGWAGVVEFETDVAAANADVNSMAYLTTPAVRGLLKTREKATNTGIFVWGGMSGANEMNGYSADVTTQIAAASMIFGDWSQIVIGEWGVLEIAMNPYANFTAAITGIRAIQTCDIGVRQAAAFSQATSIT